MAAQLFAGRRVLVLEDNYIIALELRDALIQEGANVLGPVPTVAGAIDLLTRPPKPDAALLDVELGEDVSFPLADMLIERGVPFMFVTGANPAAIPARLAGAPFLQKPFRMADVIDELELLLGGGVRPAR